tara:strand:+ start:111 stop:1199 length:1089 start_codon:yes stop_codon:yes gene_type:complete
MGNSFGDLFRVTTFGESHGGGVGVILDGCPPKLKLDIEKIQFELDRRKPGQSKITTPRKETDRVEILSGLEGNETLGTPITLIVRNLDQKPKDYKEISRTFRPSHADATYQSKYGISSSSGGGRASARETIGRVAAGAIAKQLLFKFSNTEILAWVKRIHDIEAPVNLKDVTLSDIESNIVRCPNNNVAEKMVQRISEISAEGDSCGGIIECLVRNVPRDLGAPIFDKLEADLAKAVMSLPATKGFEIGSGFDGTLLKGSEHNDIFIPVNSGEIKTLTNNSGGIQGGISNGEEISFKVAFKPTSTIKKEQMTVDLEGNAVKLVGRGRHDPCVLPRAVPMVEAMTAIVLADHLLRNNGQCNLI